jgi:tetratricopeptide (TPR) repeat protein
MVVAAAVFVLLPRWAAAPPEETQDQETLAVPAIGASPVPAVPPASPGDLRQRAYLETRIDEVAARAETLRRRLEDGGVALWGEVGYPAALEQLHQAETLRASGHLEAAQQAYARAVAALESVDARSTEVLQEALAHGRQALEAGDAMAAAAAFHLALRIAPDHQGAATGLRRAEVLDAVRALLAQGESSENAGRLEQAAATYRKAVALDPFSPPAQSALARVQARLGDHAYAAAMSEGLAALERGDHAAAEEAFGRAAGLMPGSTQAAEGLAQAREAARLETIAGHRARAGEFEAAERWAEAGSEYEAALALAPAARFAQEGKQRASRREELRRRLEFHGSHPERFISDDVLQEATELLVEAEGVHPAGPRHQEQVVRLAALLETASHPVRVRLISDDATEVTVYHVGKLGTFLSHELELRPGTYTVVGSRPGYRDVRKELVVTPDGLEEPLSILCEETI